jgi:crossover junction endodeoxyribonuclease RuvC
MRILGIDPGSRITGYGVVEVVGPGQEQLLEYGALRLGLHEDHQLRLKSLYDRLTAVIERTLPDECAVEMPVYGQDPQAMLKLGRAQAAAMLAALNREIPVTQYTPKEVKKAVTGNGNADKEQVWYMVRHLLHLEEQAPKDTLDASDALAVALCHAHRRQHGTSTAAHKTWDAFLKAHPERLKGGT